MDFHNNFLISRSIQTVIHSNALVKKKLFLAFLKKRLAYLTRSCVTNLMKIRSPTRIITLRKISRVFVFAEVVGQEQDAPPPPRHRALLLADAALAYPAPLHGLEQHDNAENSAQHGRRGVRLHVTLNQLL